MCYRAGIASGISLKMHYFLVLENTRIWYCSSLEMKNEDENGTETKPN